MFTSNPIPPLFPLYICEDQVMETSMGALQGDAVRPTPAPRARDLDKTDNFYANVATTDSQYNIKLKNLSTCIMAKKLNDCADFKAEYKVSCHVYI